MKLPDQFLQNMKRLLGEEYPSYLSCMEETSHASLRVNTLKITPEKFREISPFSLEQVSWTEKGFYFDAREDNPAGHPYYYAGLYYIQEASAMIPASILPVEKGDRVLDLCAAPGGKATELASKLDGTGLLVANDVSVSRSMALAKNLQMAGVRNAVVTAETPERLAGQMGSFFDKILVDAPCSGEGMFRRDGRMVKDWMEHGPEHYVHVQQQILEEAWKLLKPGGKMVYSTCTFSPLEDEGMIQWFLDSHGDMRICPVERKEGFVPGMPEWVEGGSQELCECVRIFPHQARGEGHFAVLLEKDCSSQSARKDLVVEKDGSGQDVRRHLKFDGGQTVVAGSSGMENRKQGRKKSFASMPDRRKNDKLANPMENFLGEVHGLEGNLCQHKESFFLSFPEMQRLMGLRIIFRGLILGEQKKNRFEPGPQLALAICREAYPRIVDLPAQDIRVMKYLKGETVVVDSPLKGYILFCVDGFPLGWCKGNGQGMLKNKYYPGWRAQRMKIH